MTEQPEAPLDSRLECLSRYLFKEAPEYQLWVETFRYSQPDAPAIPTQYAKDTGLPMLLGVKQLLDTYKPPPKWNFYDILTLVAQKAGVDVLAYMFEFIKASLVQEDTSVRATTPNSSRARELRLAAAAQVGPAAGEFSRETLLSTQSANKLLLTYLKENPCASPEGVNMLSIGVDHNTMFSTGCEALRAACQNENCTFEVVKCLIDQKHCLLNSPSARAAFRDYLSSPHTSMDTRVLELISPLATQVQREEHPAIAAAKNAAVTAEVLRFLFAKYGSVSSSSSDLLSDYLYYCNTPTATAIELLKSADTDLNSLPDGLTVLHLLASRTLSTEFVSWLIKEEKVDAGLGTTGEHRVPLHSYLCEAPQLSVEVVQLLAEPHGWCAKVDVNHLRFSENEMEWETALHAAAGNQQVTTNIIQALLNLGCNVDKTDYNEVSALAVYLEQAVSGSLKLDLIKLLEPTEKIDKKDLRHYLDEGEHQGNSSLLHLLSDRSDLTAEIVSWCLSDPERGTTTLPDNNNMVPLARYLQHGNRPEVLILLADGVSDTTNALYMLLSNYRLNIAACIPPLLLTPPMDADVSLAQYLMDSPAIDLKVLSQLQAAHLVDLSLLRESDADTDADGLSAIVLVLRNERISSTELPYLVEWLIASGGCNPAVTDDDGNHPLRIHLENEAVEPSLQLCQLLLKGTDVVADEIVPPDEEWPEGGTALDVAVTTANCPDSVLLYLASKVTNVNHKGRDLQTPLCHYLSGKYFDRPPNPDVVKLFVTDRTTTEEALSALFNSPYADSWITLPLLKILITPKTSAKKIKTADGSALHSVVTAEKDVPELVNLLVNAGADVTQTDNHGRVPLIAYMQYHVPPSVTVLQQLSSPDIDPNHIYYANLYSDGKMARRGTVQTNTALNVLLLSLSSPLHGELPDDVSLDLIRVFVSGGACACDVNVPAPVVRKCALELYLSAFKKPNPNVCLLLSDENTDRENTFKRVLAELKQNGEPQERISHVQNVFTEVLKYPPRAADGIIPSNIIQNTNETASQGTKSSALDKQAIKDAATMLSPQAQNALEHDVSGVLITEAQLHKMFSKLDTNNNGFLSKAEFKQVYKSMDNFGVHESDAEIDTWLSQYHMLGDDKISYDEFAILMLRVAQR
eukprot:TRINITY_DN64417_c0_g1_i1.p1 TRINITY_DN64417_c0_g1~~TRINITY_DN64417_c0_g1_i1.p1  ORF type:complete len:1151 (+),score=130.04 TRINITY_DN64417_c0_g1_i1:33-3455(+)